MAGFPSSFVLCTGPMPCRNVMDWRLPSAHLLFISTIYLVIYWFAIWSPSFAMKALFQVDSLSWVWQGGWDSLTLAHSLVITLYLQDWTILLDLQPSFSIHLCGFQETLLSIILVVSCYPFDFCYALNSSSKIHL